MASEGVFLDPCSGKCLDLSVNPIQIAVVGYKHKNLTSFVLMFSCQLSKRDIIASSHPLSCCQALFLYCSSCFFFLLSTVTPNPIHFSIEEDWIFLLLLSSSISDYILKNYLLILLSLLCVRTETSDAGNRSPHTELCFSHNTKRIPP